MTTRGVTVPADAARRIWLHAQRLDVAEPFGHGPRSTLAAIEHLGYVQIDSINVIERAHHHILFSRIPGYRRADLHRAQTVDKTVFETWTHALSYVPVGDYKYFVPAMRSLRTGPWLPWNKGITADDVRVAVKRIRDHGPLKISDIKDDVLVEKDWAWASRKPSKRALDIACTWGLITVSERTGIIKTFELTERQFGWEKKPRAATEKQVIAYGLDRALRAQGLVSVASVVHRETKAKAAVRELIEQRVRRRELVPVTVGDVEHWATPETLDTVPRPVPGTVHLLSPFDPLVIQRKRLELFFGYTHLFEAYVPRQKRVFGYFALPVLVNDEIVAVIDLKTDRSAGAMLIQQWTWVGNGRESTHRQPIEDALARFEQFQLNRA
ncbi:winged helix-turn-helix domain-containing protein [Actinoplanes sp. NPDC051513]|uniref:winged helix-turn-helix domain-containing protein n=1 Tax=Actinoplanes sp. NPDC051513 TaxID=3363908 RepID=UPI003798C52F